MKKKTLSLIEEAQDKYVVFSMEQAITIKGGTGSGDDDEDEDDGMQ